MAYIIADNIISPLGDTSAANYQAVKSGRSALRGYSGAPFEGCEPFTSALLDRDQRERITLPGLSYFESKAVASARKAMSSVDMTGGSTRLILSSTKGDSALLGSSSGAMGQTAARIASALGVTTQPVVVSNACISGLAAIILGARMIDANQCDYAIIIGCDDISRFVVSGFQSLKAMSPERCRPFDLERNGLNLGEAAATVILSREPVARSDWRVAGGVVRNDAYHLTSPSRAADGQFGCLTQLLSGTSADDIGFINLHGTATFFNDQMESVALRRAALGNVPANALKGYFGHTLGAAGVLETIISMKAADDGTVPATAGFERLGVSGNVNLSAQNRATSKQVVVKMLSGFGGCNAAALLDKKRLSAPRVENATLSPTHHVTISPTAATIDNKPVDCPAQGKDLLTALYKAHVGDYPKFYKMDGLSRLGFIATELLLNAENQERFTTRSDRAVILFNLTSSIEADQEYIASIADPDNYFPSPSLFIYTLPNIVTGEIAIRNRWNGETSLFILPSHDNSQERAIIEASCLDPATRSVVAGWIDYTDSHNFEADLHIYQVKH